MKNTRTPSRRQPIPEQLIGKREALFHLLRTPMRTAAPQGAQAETERSEQAPEVSQHVQTQISQMDDFIFRD